jgi:hypothetical protein
VYISVSYITNWSLSDLISHALKGRPSIRAGQSSLLTLADNLTWTKDWSLREIQDCGKFPRVHQCSLEELVFNCVPVEDKFESPVSAGSPFINVRTIKAVDWPFRVARMILITNFLGGWGRNESLLIY